MRQEDVPNKELYATKRMVHITEECPKGKLLYLERTYLVSSIDSAVVALEEGIERFKVKEYEETPLPILHSGSRGITVMEADISTIYIVRG